MRLLVELLVVFLVAFSLGTVLVIVLQRKLIRDLESLNTDLESMNKDLHTTAKSQAQQLRTMEQRLRLATSTIFMQARQRKNPRPKGRGIRN